jgi:hypothetical protein
MKSIEPKLLELNPKSVVKIYLLIRKFTDFDIMHIHYFKNVAVIFRSQNIHLRKNISFVYTFLTILTMAILSLIYPRELKK